MSEQEIQAIADATDMFELWAERTPNGFLIRHCLEETKL